MRVKNGREFQMSVRLSKGELSEIRRAAIKVDEDVSAFLRRAGIKLAREGSR